MMNRCKLPASDSGHLRDKELVSGTSALLDWYCNFVTRVHLYGAAAFRLLKRLRSLKRHREVNVDRFIAMRSLFYMSIDKLVVR
jgi:hypothetical protein